MFNNKNDIFDSSKWNSDWTSTSPKEWKEMNKLCNDPSHHFPSMMYVAPGEEHVHTCPSCGLQSMVQGNWTYL
jgi:hypothetical protein